jgi:CrcB protein
MGMKLLAIAGAGAVGALFRFGLSNGVYRILGREFPYGTLVVNVLGSLLIGYFFVLFLERMDASEVWRSAILIGLLGSFTTFSTFSLETLNLFNDGAYVKAMLNVILSVAMCLAGTWMGFALARQL